MGRINVVCSASFVLLLAQPLHRVVRAGEGPSKASELVKGVIARFDAVFSGEIAYHMKHGFVVPAKITGDEDYRFAFSGPSWILHSPYGVELSHRGKHVEYRHGPPGAAGVHTWAQVGPPQSFIDKEIRGSPPYFAGTVWFKVPRDFIKRNPGKGKLRGEREVNGVKAKILEWEISEADAYKGFGSINAMLAKGGKLRLYVSPKLGFALPRIEHVDTDGRNQALFEAHLFKERSPGIFVPAECSMQYYDYDGAGYYCTYNIKSFSKVNETLPDSVFSATIPEGTSLADLRSPKDTKVFQIGGDSQGDVTDLIKVGFGRDGRFWQRPWVAISIGVVVGGLLLTWYLLRKSTTRS